MAEKLRHAGTETGIDPAPIAVWRELGYVVTEDTRHLLSVGDIAAWNETVHCHVADQEPPVPAGYPGGAARDFNLDVSVPTPYLDEPGHQGPRQLARSAYPVTVTGASPG